jgi:clathrin heavy chain
LHARPLAASPRRDAPRLPQANLQLVVNIAKEYTEQLGAEQIIALLESYNSYPGLYLYLGSRIAFT